MLNRVELIGNLGSDPTLKELAQGRKAASFHLATHRRWTGRDGERQEDLQWHPVVFWGKQAELTERLLRKGQLVYIEGRLNHARWTDDEDRTHYRTEIVGRSLLILSPKVTGDPAEVSSQQAERRRP